MKRLYFMNEQGAVLVTSVGLVLVMMAMGICLSKISTNELNNATLKARKEAASYAAETGWMVAANWLENRDPEVHQDVKNTILLGDTQDLFRGGVNSSGRGGVPAYYDVDVVYGGSVSCPKYSSGAGKTYQCFKYIITSYGYVPRDLQQIASDQLAAIRQSGRSTEITVDFYLKKEK